VVAFEMRARTPQRLIEPAERRAAITGNETRGIDAGAQIALALKHQEADQRLRTGKEDAAALQRVLVVQGSCSERSVINRGVHRASPQKLCSCGALARVSAARGPQGIVPRAGSGD